MKMLLQRWVLLQLIALQSPCFAQSATPDANEQIHALSEALRDDLLQLQKSDIPSAALHDVQVCLKAADWIVRHHEFFEPAYAKWTITTLELGHRRAVEAKDRSVSWFPRPGSTVLGYQSDVDHSIQPYAVTFPKDFKADADRAWPLYVVLHGRNAKLNEVSFFHQFEGKPLKDETEWIQLDIFGRTNNAYRWAGEADVFEAIADLKRRVKIDENRITLHGFSMGGAGAWHLGMHHPSVWASVGAGAGFVDTVHHLKLETPLSPLHEQLVRIYDAQEYALNAFDVPVIGYGGDQDPQLFAAQTMHDRANKLGIEIPLLIGQETAHKFHPESLKQFMSFLASHNQPGRPTDFRNSQVRFVTYTPRYHRCRWIAVNEQIEPYQASIVESGVDSAGQVCSVSTQNVRHLGIGAGVAMTAMIDGQSFSLRSVDPGSANSEIHFRKSSDGWQLAKDVVNGLRKQHGLQGPIDDAFMESFVCVTPTRDPWSSELNDWADWTFQRFRREFDHRLRGQIPTVDDRHVTAEMIEHQNLILFGDPGSNSLIEKIVQQLPIRWSKSHIQVDGQSFSTTNHSVALIYPNPLNPRKYVVINSGHTFHDAEFEKSNANLYPRLGDVAVLEFAKTGQGFYDESVKLAEVFDCDWKFKASKE